MLMTLITTPPTTRAPISPVVSLLEDHTPGDAIHDDRQHHRIDPVSDFREAAVRVGAADHAVDPGEQDQTVTKQSARPMLRRWARQA